MTAIAWHQPFLPGDDDVVSTDWLPAQGRTAIVNGVYLGATAPRKGDTWVTRDGVEVVIHAVQDLWHGGCRLWVTEACGRLWLAEGGQMRIPWRYPMHRPTGAEAVA